ncbi:MAG: 50S ribosomal protein L3 [Gemmatimonadetes bacterium]|jgi:large subunit ribosomal protein L3|nr:50S ribosomal protein L3 [Gemmatimonadota bacterium]
MVGLIGKKLGMTQIFDEKEKLIPVTVVEVGPCPIVQVKSEKTDGYAALQLAFDEIPERKANKPRSGQFAKAGVKPHRVLQEMRGDTGEFEVGQVLDVTQFEVGDMVKVTGRSKGKGFAGVVKRYHFSGHGATHGTPNRVRHGGSIGQGTTPGKVWKGKKMPGQMGNAKVSVKGLAIVRVDPERHLLFVKGAIPGGVNGYLTIVKS